ncbi:hypothetical protein AAHB33_09515 [Paenarthrobacter sp. S56]
MTLSGLIGLAIAVIIPVVGAMLGGKAGMHFHRKVDQAALTDRDESY